MKYNNAKRSIPVHPTFVIDTHRDLHLWTVTSKINRVYHGLHVCQVWYGSTQWFSLYWVHSFFPYVSTVTLTFDLWPPKSIGTIPSPLLTCLQNLIKKHTQFSSYSVHKLISIYVHCDLDLWPLTSKINRVHPLTIANMSTKFDQEAHNSLVAIVFTSLFPYMSIVTLTFHLWPSKSIGLILSPWLTCLPSLIKKHTTV